MSFHHQITFKCDTCELNWIINQESMELPPGWLALQIVVADTDGCIPEREQELYCHFCSQKCLTEYTSGDEIRNRLCLADKDSDDSDDSDDSEEFST